MELKVLRKILLFQIPIFPKILQSILIHNITQ